MKKPNPHHQAKPSAFTLPLVIIVGLILMVGGLAVLARSFSGLTSSVRQEQARQAREIAETGLARTLEKLNSKYTYLLINDYPTRVRAGGTWASPTLPSSICPGSRVPGMPNVTGITTNPNGRYRVDVYIFSGTQFYGGTGRLKVTGERLNSLGVVQATATVEESFDVKTKNCDARFGEVATSSGFPGLLGWNVNLGNNDVKGVTSGNVLCIQCTLADPNRPPTQGEAEVAVGALHNSDVDGRIFIGPVSAPPVLTFPAALRGLVTANSITSSTTITASATGSSSSANNGNMCATDSSLPPITHCLVSSINLSGKNLLRVDSTNGPVRLYVSGNVSASGSSGITNVTCRVASSPANPCPSGQEFLDANGYYESDPGRLGMFGNPISSNPVCVKSSTCYSQEVTLAGASKPGKGSHIFAYFPDGKVGINGGAQGAVICDETGECGGGDIHGAVWAKVWNGSSSNNATLVVPPDMASIVLNNFGTQYAISVRDYVAIGINSWKSFQGF